MDARSAGSGTVQSEEGPQGFGNRDAADWAAEGPRRSGRATGHREETGEEAGEMDVVTASGKRLRMQLETGSTYSCQNQVRVGD